MLLHRLNKGFAHKVFRETELNEFENGYRNENRKVKNDNISDEVITKKEKRMNTKYEILKNIFGYDTFREGQETLVDSTLSGRDVLGIMPTGAGKSICFQVPALMFEGITIVVSPLISLMKDQVAALNQAGVHAAYINSSLTEGQYRKAMENARRGQYKIIYVAPERLMTDSFQSLMQEVEISMTAVDEAHCISQW